MRSTVAAILSAIRGLLSLVSRRNTIVAGGHVLRECRKRSYGAELRLNLRPLATVPVHEPVRRMHQLRRRPPDGPELLRVWRLQYWTARDREHVHRTVHHRLYRKRRECRMVCAQLVWDVLGGLARVSRLRNCELRRLRIHNDGK